MKGELKVKEEDFNKYGINPNQAEIWEDGMRLDYKKMKPGEYEWWYADGHLDDGYFFSTTFQAEIDKNGKEIPFILLNIAKDNKTLIDTRIEIDPQGLAFKKEICDAKFGKNYFKSLDGLNRYEIYIDPQANNGDGFHLFLDRTAPSFRPGTGIWEANGDYFAWFCTVPSATVTGTITTGGKTIDVKGNGYHDHNWGNCTMSSILGDWLWSRAEVEGLTVVTSSVRFNPKNGGAETNYCYVTRGNEILINKVNDGVTCLEGVKKPHPKTGKLISSDCIYITENKSNQYDYVRFAGDAIVSEFPFGENDEYITWYARYVADAIVDIEIDGKRFVKKAHSTLEIMDFFGEKK